MKKMKRIVTLLMTVVMMMAMSVTAFAAEVPAAAAASGVTVKVTNLAKDEATELKLFKIADVKNNTATFDGWDFATWFDKKEAIKGTKTLANDIEEYEFDWDKVQAQALAAEKAGSVTPTTYTTKATDDVFEAEYTFTNLTGAAYLVVATSSSGEYIYKPMGAKTYEYTAAGAYALKSATVVAKSSSVPVHKTADDQFVHVGQTVTFDIKTAVPNVEKADGKFVVYDAPVNLEDLSLVSVKLDGVPQDLSKFTLVDPTDNVKEYAIDLKEVLGTENVGKTVIITISATVGENIVLSEGQTAGYAYKNSAWSNLSTPKTTPDVIGYTGDIVLTKYDDSHNVLSGAKFVAYLTETVDGESVVKYLSFKLVSTGEYKFTGFVDEADDATEIEATNGTVKVTGLKEGKYSFHETVAPNGYALNSTDAEATLEASTNENKHATTSMSDTKLVQLPFTGGMGTTIFTVLGVAIMAIAAALFFATKKSKN